MARLTQSTLFRRFSFLGLFALLGLAIACTGAPSSAGADEGDKPTPGRMTVSGTGMASAAPDMAYVQMGVISEAKTAREALNDNNAAMSRVMTRLKDMGIAEKDMQTSNFSVSPRYKSYPRGTTGPRVIEGYSVSNTLAVAVRDLDKLGPVLDATVSDGANQFYGLNFAFADPKPMMDEARKGAVADARAKAELLATAAGVKLGRIIQISENSYGRPQPMAMARSADMEGAVPIAAGESSLSANVSLTYELH